MSSRERQSLSQPQYILLDKAFCILILISQHLPDDPIDNKAKIKHRTDFIWMLRCLISPATWLFVQKIILQNSKEPIKALYYRPFVLRSHLTNSFWPSDAIWWHRSGSTLALVIAFCLTAQGFVPGFCDSKSHIHEIWKFYHYLPLKKPIKCDLTCQMFLVPCTFFQVIFCKVAW